VQAGQLPIARGRALTEDDLLRGALIERVMCEAWIEEAAVPRSVMATAGGRLKGLIADGLVRREAGRLAVTEAGRPFLRHFAACFDAFLAPSPARHSAAV
jgi:oxygen-independent coproporphyrinogen-3 oxidase